MKANFRSRTARGLVFSSLVFVTSHLRAGAPSTCDDMAQDVRVAVSKDPAKVLMIVEDALVINEACACEIVKAAISASNADEAKVQEIVQSAIAVAPKMSAIIVECAGAASGVTIASADTGDAKNPKGSASDTDRDPLGAGGSKDKGEGGTSGDGYTTSARSVYLVNQPAAIVDHPNDDDDDDDDGGKRVNRANSRRSRNLVPLSPALAVVN